ncbi:MAG: hypothetical protein V3R86_01165 [Candidatus Hydrothermarchaeaceae archaeon]
MYDIYPRWKGKPLILTKSAYNHLIDLGEDGYFVRDILDEGFDCAKSKRAKATIERCVKHRGKITKVVVVADYSRVLKEEVWLVTHVSD